MDLSPKIHAQRSSDDTWYVTLTVKGFRNLDAVEKFLKVMSSKYPIKEEEQATLDEEK